MKRLISGPSIRPDKRLPKSAAGPLSLGRSLLWAMDRPASTGSGLLAVASQLTRLLPFGVVTAKRGKVISKHSVIFALDVTCCTEYLR